MRCLQAFTSANAARGDLSRLVAILAWAWFALLLGVCLVVADAHAETGTASVYWAGDRAGGQPGTATASGRPLRNGALTAAHKTARLGSRVRVTNRTNGRSVVVTITDRGPYVRGRVIDLTPAGAKALGFSGLSRVTVEGAG